jgi:hypothetical protein
MPLTHESPQTPLGPYNHVSQILFGVDNELAELHGDAREYLVGGDNDGYNASICAQTVIIAGLAERVSLHKHRGGQVSDEIEEFTTNHSREALRAQEEGIDYSRFVFFPTGTDKKGPSTLRQLADRSLI